MASASWTDEETCKLIEIRGDESIQAMLEGCKSKCSADNTNTFIRDAILSRKFVNITLNVHVNYHATRHTPIFPFRASAQHL